MGFLQVADWCKILIFPINTKRQVLSFQVGHCYTDKGVIYTTRPFLGCNSTPALNGTCYWVFFYGLGENAYTFQWESH